MRALIVGLGSIGKRHLQNLRTILPEADITVWRQHGRSDDDAALNPQATRFVYSMEDALQTRPDIAIIANPAPLHINTGLLLARVGVSLLIEKPISNKTEGISELIELCANRSLTLMVGYNLRFQTALQALSHEIQKGTIGAVLCLQAEIGQYLPEWRPKSDYLQGVSAQSRLGGGVVLELSHELDYARWLMGEVVSVSAQLRRLGPITIDVEDTANIHLTFGSGALGNIHMNMIQRHSSRTCTVVGTQGTLSWDGILGEVKHYSAKTKSWQTIFASPNYDRNEMFLGELKHFIMCVTSGSTPSITGEDGLRVLEIALAAHESSRTQRTVCIEPR